MSKEEYRAKLLEIFARHFTLIAREIEDVTKECKPKDIPMLSTQVPKTQQQNSLEYPPFDGKWTEYASGKGVWAFSNQDGVEELVARVKVAKGKTLVDGNWKYRLSGEDDKFLQAFPVKKEDKI